MKYAIHPDYIVSKIDGDVHYVRAEALIHLYRVHPQDCVVIDDKADRRTYANLMRLAEEDNLIHLWPRFDGNYNLKERNAT